MSEQDEKPDLGDELIRECVEFEKMITFASKNPKHPASVKFKEFFLVIKKNHPDKKIPLVDD